MLDPAAFYLLERVGHRDEQEFRVGGQAPCMGGAALTGTYMVDAYAHCAMR